MKGFEKIWIIRDEFTHSSYYQYYRDNKHAGTHMTYAFEQFEVLEFLSSKYSNVRSAPCRLRNNLVKAVNDCKEVPKLIVIVVDADITRYIHLRDDMDRTVAIGKITEWLLRECYRAVESFKDYLPKKAKRVNLPQFLWMLPPTHKYFTRSANEKRIIQGNFLTTVAKLYQNMAVLRMLKVWDHEDGAAVLYDNTRFTAQGLTNYWLSVDSAIRYWNVVLSPKTGNENKFRKQKNKYKWKKPQKEV